jgi:acetoin utilization protein AcuB
VFIEDYMTPDPRTIGADDPLRLAQELMDRHHVRHLPVVDRARRLEGIVTDRDMRSAVGYKHNIAEDLTVAEVMSAEPTTIPVDATLDEAVAVFCTSRVGALPVMRNHSLVGIITRHDILKAFRAILGVDEPGCRIEVALPNPAEDLPLAFAALRSSTRPIISAVVSRMRRDGGEPALYIRVEGDDPRPVEKLLRDAALIVLKPEHD